MHNQTDGLYDSCVRTFIAAGFFCFSVSAVAAILTIGSPDSIYLSGTWSCDGSQPSSPERTSCFGSNMPIDALSGISGLDSTAGLFPENQEDLGAMRAELVSWLSTDQLSDADPKLSQILFLRQAPSSSPGT